MNRSLFMFLVIILMFVLSACSGEGNQSSSDNSGQGEITMKVGIGVPETHYEYEAMEKFKESLESETDGQINVEIYPANQIGTDSEVLESIKQGTAHMNLPSPAVLSNIVKEYNVLSLPFIFPDQAVADAVIEGPVGEELLSKLEDKGYVGLGFGDFGFRHTTNSKHPIEEVEDFEGLKIRTMENPAHLDVFRELGANPTPMAFDELFSSLQQGVVDGQENPLPNIYSNKIHEVQPFLTLDGHVYEWVVFVVGKDFYDNLSPDQQKALQNASDVAIQHMRSAVKDADAEALEGMKEAGVEVTELSPEAKEEMVEKVNPIVEKYAEEIDIDLYNRLVEEVDKNSN